MLSFSIITIFNFSSLLKLPVLTTCPLMFLFLKYILMINWTRMPSASLPQTNKPTYNHSYSQDDACSLFKFFNLLDWSIWSCQYITTFVLHKWQFYMCELNSLEFMILHLCCQLSPPPNFSVSTSSLVAQMVKNMPVIQKTCVWSLCPEDLLEKRMATHTSILAWRIAWTEEPGGLQSMWSRRVGHD